MAIVERLRQCVAFEWDERNSEKNWLLHGVSRGEAEQLFFNQPLLVAGDEAHSATEKRYYALGTTNRNRLLFVVFTLRGDLIRVISARDMTKRESDLQGVMKQRKRKLESEDEERKYWAAHDAADEVDWSTARKVTLPNLRPSVKTISLRIPESMLEELKLLANKRDVPYQSLIKVFLSDRIRRELKKDAA